MIMCRRRCSTGATASGATGRRTGSPADDVDTCRLTAVIYREYLDPGYVGSKPDKPVVADLNEPAFPRRVPGSGIYTRPGNRLRTRKWFENPIRVMKS
jgi:hypothetical protein